MTTALYESLERLIDAGDEPGVRAFLAAHVNEFPEEDREQIILVMFEDAIGEHAEGIETRQAFIEEGTQALGRLNELKALLEKRMNAFKDENRLGELKGRLGMK